MVRYYDMEKLKNMIETKADTLIEGKEAFLYVAKWLELLPAADVVPRDYVVKIFEEIQEEIVAALASNYRVRGELLAKKDIAYEMVACINGKINALRGIEGFIEELKEKYTKGGEQK